ncbi:hypothetical protein PUMCH_004931 [Australozyma saopauloensis]|uniref:DUF985 domain-containing protein n=1 Tax=Australozyma saopauloensis TaxID=291208 RepID=A0AAX4HFZ4_9ASCO|nr:hypothetical protein PUMCH_004931 [[Candida] saopauloensis]
MTSLLEYVSILDLLPHPDGGYFKETGRSSQVTKSATGLDVPLFTNIHFLLVEKHPSFYHQIKSDEVWYYHDGQTLTVHCIFPNGDYKEVKLGRDVKNGEVLQFEVPSGVIFASSVEKEWALVSCMVSPGFDFREFRSFSRAELLEKFPEHEESINKLTRDE